MAVEAELLTSEEFTIRYSGLKPYYEYWNGVPVRKAMPTWLHGLIQRIIADLLEEAGYVSGSEVELRIDKDWRPIPDVIAATIIEQPYPTKPVEIVVEILSPDDRMEQVIEKCRRYGELGIEQILILDPEHRGGAEWDKESGRLTSALAFHLANGERIELSEVWTRLDLKLRGRSSGE